jgi:hypothetical protein
MKAVSHPRRRGCYPGNVEPNKLTTLGHSPFCNIGKNYQVQGKRAITMPIWAGLLELRDSTSPRAQDGKQSGVGRPGYLNVARMQCRGGWCEEQQDAFVWYVPLLLRLTTSGRLCLTQVLQP